MPEIYKALLEHAEGIDIIDTHEHLPAFENMRDKPTDVLHEYLAHYFNRDLANAGLPPEGLERACDSSLPLMERWMLVEPYWELARKTGYGQALDITARVLYGLDGIRRGTVEALDTAFQKTLAGGQYRQVLQETCRIKTSLLVDIQGLDMPCDTAFFRRVFDVTYFVFPKSFEELAVVERASGIKITCLEDWKQAFDVCLDKEVKAGAVAVKNSLAYERPLCYNRVSTRDAEDDFNAMFARRHMPEWSNRSLYAGRSLQDHMMHHVLRRLNERGMVIQFHTGLLEGVGNYIANSDPVLLSNLFLEYGDVRFDIFHIGYPYEKTLTALAKMFPNVFIDMCWAHIISPSACVHILREWLDTVALNKISAFGGDYRVVDPIAGHLAIARRNVCRALADKLADGLFDMEEAKRALELMFYENPKRLFGLKDM